MLSCTAYQSDLRKKAPSTVASLDIQRLKQNRTQVLILPTDLLLRGLDSLHVLSIRLLPINALLHRFSRLSILLIGLWTIDHLLHRLNYRSSSKLPHNRARGRSSI